MSEEFASTVFPSFASGVRAKWAPIILEPIAGSYERLVIGVAVVGANDFHLEEANALHRLRCYYSEDGEGVTYAIRLALDYLRQDLVARSLDALTDPRPAISGAYVLPCRDAEANSLKEIGANWMRALSSLYREEVAAIEQPAANVLQFPKPRAVGGDRLPTLVLEYVTERRAGYAPFFASDIREGKMRRSTNKSHEVVIDFAGSRLAANFGTLQAQSITKSVHLIKRRLWDLKVDRDDVSSGIGHREHEMIVQAPRSTDPQVTEKQQAKLAKALDALEQQADQESLKLLALSSVEEIGERVLRLEVA